MNPRAHTAALRQRLAGRRGATILLAAVAALTSTIMVSPAGAVSGVTGTGSPACNSGWAGTMSFNPALQAGGTAAGVTVVMQAAFQCAGGSPAPVPPPSSGSYVAKGFVSMAGANDCAHWFAAYPGPFPVVAFAATAHLDGNVAWSPAGINPSNVNFASVKITTGSAGRLTIKLPAPPGSGTVTGSYVPTARLSLRTAQSFAAVSTACGTAAGLTSLKIVAANPAGIFSHGTW